MSKSSSLSKSRPGGGQSQSNQRQSDYSRQERSNFPIRQGNSQGVHPVAPNSLQQVNMHSQHPQVQAQQPHTAPQVIQNPQMIRHPTYQTSHQQQPNQQPLVSPQTMAVPHVNPTSGHPGVLQQNVIRTQQFTTPYIQNARMPNPMSNARPHFHPRPNNNVHQIQAIPTPQQQVYYSNPYSPYNTQQIYFPLQAMGPTSYQVNPAMPMYTDHFQQQQQMRNFQSTQPQINMQNNLQPNEMLNQTSNLYNHVMPPQQPQQQPQQQPKLESRREKKILKIFNDDGTEFDLNKEIANDDNKKTSVSKDSSSNEKPPLSEAKNSVAEEQIAPTVNGIEKEIEPSSDEQKVSDLPISEEPIKSSEEIAVHAEVIDQSIDSVQAALMDKANNQCDKEPIEVAQDSSNDIANNDEIVEITTKISDIALEDQTENTDSAEVISHNEEYAPMSDNSNIVSANTISGDMDVDTVKSIDDPTINLSNSEDSAKADENSSVTPSAKDESDPEPKLSRNSSQNGSRIYEREFLLSLKDLASSDAISLSNQDNLRDIIKKAGNKTSSHDMFLPTFTNQGRSSQNESFRNKSQGQSVRRPSQPSKNYQDSKSRKITSTSMHSEMFTPAENAWRPGKNTTDDPVEAETENLLKHVRAILNKLTPQNYQTLLEQFKSLKIDTKNRLTRVIDLIFDKAVKEPSFVVQYAGFCSELIHIKVTETNAKGENVEVKFKNLLIKKCEETFFREMYSDIDNYSDRIKEIDECSDEKKKKDLDAIFDDDKRLSRRRSIGNIKLIAELYKLNMLNAKIMFSCFHNLLKHQHEEYIECLCALITNIGLNLTNAIKSKSADQMDSFESIFSQLQAIYNDKSPLKVSSRIRFMILDLLDLRKNGWVPRRKADGPKTIAQVHEDMDKEARLKSLELSELKKKKPPGARDVDEWQQVKPRKSGSIAGPTKLNLSSLNQLKESLTAGKPSIGAGSSPFGMFAHGSHGGTNSNSQSRSSSSTFENKYQLLSNDRAPKSNSTFHDSLHTKDHLRGGERKTSDVTNYYQSNRDGSLPNSRNSSIRSDNFEAKSNIQINLETFSNKTNELINSYLSSPNYNTAVSELLLFCSKNLFNVFLTESMSIALDKNSSARQSWGEFLGQLFVNSIYDCSEIFEGLKILFSKSEDFDLPKFWEFIGEIIANALLKVHESGNDNIKREIYKVTSRAFGEVAGNNLTKLRRSFTDTLNQLDDSTDILSFVFNSQSNAKNDIQGPESNQNVELDAIVDNFLKRYLDTDCEISNLAKEMQVNSLELQKFISALFKKIASQIANDILKQNSDPDVAHVKSKLVNILRYYIKLRPESEVELLFTSADLYRSLHNPPNLLSELFTLFHTEKLASGDSFKQFQNSKRTHPLALTAVERTIRSFS